jgi:glutathione S-transferase
MTLRLHDYAASGNCYKVRLLLAQLGREYERVPVDIFAGDTLTDDFGELNPVRETPVLEEEGADPLPESNAILVYLAEGTDYLPDTPAARAQALRWLFWEQSEIIPAMAGLRFRLQTGRLSPDGRGSSAAAPAATRSCDWWTAIYATASACSASATRWPTSRSTHT